MKLWKTGALGKQFAASVSGGKDSILALYKAMEQGRALVLISMLRQEDGLAGEHGVTEDILQAQAESLGIPLLTRKTDWAGYGGNLIACLKQAKALGAEVLVTGDIDLPKTNCWYEKIVEQVQMELACPLWQIDRQKAVEEFINLGFLSKVVMVNTRMGMRESDLGRIMTPAFIEELKERGIDCCGEAGEFHTIVLDGPIFRTPVAVKEGALTRRGDKVWLALELA